MCYNEKNTCVKGENMLDILFSPSQTDGALDSVTSNSTAISAESAAILGLVYIVALLLMSILSIVATIKLYRKIGVNPLVIFVPIYNSYVFYKAFGVRRWFWAIFLCYIAACALFAALIPQMASNVALIVILNVVITVLSIVVLLGSLHCAYNMARSFGKGFSFFCGLLIFSPLFYLILAFGKSDYIGAPD